MIPVLYLVFNLIYSALSIPAGPLADRIGRRKVALIGFAVFAGAYAWMALARSQAAAWGVFAVYGVYMAIADGNGRALLAEFSRESGTARRSAPTTWSWGSRRCRRASSRVFSTTTCPRRRPSGWARPPPCLRAY